MREAVHRLSSSGGKVHFSHQLRFSSQYVWCERCAGYCTWRQARTLLRACVGGFGEGGGGGATVRGTETAYSMLGVEGWLTTITLNAPEMADALIANSAVARASTDSSLANT